MTSTLGSLRFSIALLWLLAALLAAPLRAAAPTPAALPTGSERFDRGLLWRIERAGSAPSYLFGTLHSDDPRVLNLPAPVQQAFDRSRRFTMEAVMDAPALAALAEHMYFHDDQTLPSVIGETLYRRTQRTFQDAGLPVAGLERQKPWIIVMLLSMPPPRTGLFLDLALQQRALEQNKPVTGLETVAEQVAVFDELPAADQAALLKETLDNYPHLQGQIDEMTKRYLARDTGGILRMAAATRPADGRLYDTVMRRLLADRNARMVERMRATLTEGNAFIAVGAGHLPGPDGLLMRLERAGYRLQAVY